MKLINLIIGLFNVLLNIVYYLVASPVLIPLEIYKWSKNRKWRKNVNVDDKCFYINIMGTRSYGKVTAISEDKLKARVERREHGSYSSGWYEIDGLRVV
jgi:hypothetical protein